LTAVRTAAIIEPKPRIHRKEVPVLGSSDPYYVTVLLWLARTAFFTFVSAFLLWLGIGVLDVLTPRIHERRLIGQSPAATGLFVGGFLIFVGLVVHGAATLPFLIGASRLDTVFAPTRLGLLAAGFFLSLLVGVVLFRLFDWLTPKISFREINKEPLAVGLYVFGYMLFFGLVTHAALTTPL
jgi:uncharacterized membrane protein YjfL (UPF0719 family)